MLAGLLLFVAGRLAASPGARFGAGGREENLANVAAAGLSWSRVPTDIHPGDMVGGLPSSPVVTMFDERVLAVQQAGLKVFAILNPKRHPDTQAWPAAANFASVLGYFVERYDGDGVDDMPGLLAPVGHWEIVNEYLSDDLQGQWNGFSQATYVQYCQQGRAALKAAAAGASFAVGSLVGGELHDFKDFKAAWDAGVAVDFISYHNYSPDDFCLADAAADLWGHDPALRAVPFIITECAFYDNPAQTAATQVQNAAWLPRAAVQSFVLNTQVIIYAEMTAHPMWSDERLLWMAMIDQAGARRPNYHTYVKLNETVGDFTAVTEVATSAGASLYRFDLPSGGPVLLAWANAEDGGEVALSGLSGCTTVTVTLAVPDTVGDAVVEPVRFTSWTVPVVGGAAVVDLFDDTPAYLSAGGTAELGPVGNDDWVSLGGIPGIDGPSPQVLAMAWHGGSLYAGGTFTLAGGTTVSNIARWDGAAWHALGVGVNDRVRALAVGPDGTLYAGGDFTTAGGAPANRIARWDGTSWSPLGEGMDDAVHALAVAPDGTLYAGGNFMNAGGAPAQSVAHWDGSAWSKIGGGWEGGGVNGAPLALACAPNGDLYLGGSFTMADGGWLHCNRIVRWDGSDWHTLGTGMANLGESVMALRWEEGTGLYAAGRFTEAGGVAGADRVALWTGASWQALGSGLGLEAWGLAKDASGRILVSGAFGISRWDGFVWGWPGSGCGSAYGLAADDAGRVFVGGSFCDVGDAIQVKCVAGWDGAAWHPLGEGLNFLGSHVAADDAGRMHVSGTFTHAGPERVNYLARRGDDDAWHDVGGGVDKDGVGPMVADGADGLFVGGWFSQAGGTVPAAYVAHWDGAAWQALGTGVNNGVRALAYDAAQGDLYAGGAFTEAGGGEARAVARWDGMAWQALADGLNSTVFALLHDPDTGDIFAGGAFDVSGMTPMTGVARWDGSAWHAVGGGVNGTVYAMALDADGNLYVGGSFSQAGGNAAANVAKWDGVAWSPLGSGADDEVCSLVCDVDGNLYAGGLFTLAGGLAAERIARWDGSAWAPLGSGIDRGNLVSGMAFDPVGNLFVAGDFASAGGKTSSHAAKLLLRHRVRFATDGSPGAYILGADDQIVPRRGGTTPVTPVPGDGYTFIGWSGDHVGQESPLAFASVTADLAVTANFAPTGDTATLTLGHLGNGSTSPHGAMVVVKGASMALTATPDAGNQFIRWDIFGGAALGDIRAAETTATLSGDAAVTAVFAADGEVVMLTVQADGNGSVAPSGSIKAIQGEGEAIAATPDAHHHLVLWSATAGAVVAIPAQAATTVTLSQDATVTANFAVDEYTVIFRTDGTEGATVNGAAIFTQVVTHGGDCLPVVAVAPRGYDFLGWTGGFVGMDNPLTLMDIAADLTVVATFQMGQVACGSVFGIEAANVGLDRFRAKPKVYVTYFRPVTGKPGKAAARVLDKPDKELGAPTLACEWIRKIRLYDGRAFKAAEAGGVSAAAWITAVGMDDLPMEVHVVGKEVEDQVVHPLALAVPIIADIVDGGQDANGNSLLVITGTWFGTKKPKVWREYVVQGKDGDVIRRQTMKVLKPTEVDALAGFVDSKGKPAYMNPATGASKATAIVPGKSPKGGLNGMIVLENGVGLAAGAGP
jgi:uncharacterized repeat protein (TIGR02543 family)